MWDLKEAFPDREVVNHGFGGSHLSDLIHFADRVILNRKWKTIFVYAGDNDIAHGKSPERVASDFRALFSKIHGAQPNAKVFFVAIKPSLARLEHMAAMAEANAKVRAFSMTQDSLEFVDVFTPMLGADGKPRPELFIEDGLHMNREGYALWNSLVLPHFPVTPPDKTSQAPPPSD